MADYLFRKKILIVPLDWGLGHASRCIPIIKHLLQKGCEVIIAADGEQLSLLNKEFPGLRSVLLKGYSVNYSRYKRWFGVKILWQIPKIMLSIRQEHIWLKNIINDYKLDLVISDNRYGLYSDKIPCIFITHQLAIQAPFKWLRYLIQKINYRYISKFTACWVPDFAGDKNIAGALSHPQVMPPAITKYMGPLARFSHLENISIVYKYLFVLSGPEPQRSMLEEKVLKIAGSFKEKILIIRGKPLEKELPVTLSNCNIKNHLGTGEMQTAFLQSEFIISRSGYTTVMELLSLGKKSILIPTPGQTEQEYLAKHLMQQKWCYCCKQSDDLLHHLQQAEKFSYKLPELQAPVYEKVIDEFLNAMPG